jgi:hypothetical protein
MVKVCIRAELALISQAVLKTVLPSQQSVSAFGKRFCSLLEYFT